MTKRVAFLLAVTALAAGCSGGGAAPQWIPRPVAEIAANATSAQEQSEDAVLRIVFSRNPAFARAPRYISPNTKSLSVVVQPVTAKPWPSAMPVQVLVVATPSPCTESAGTMTCDFRLRVHLGIERFTLKAYASSNASGAPLSMLQTGDVAVGKRHKKHKIPKPLHFVLEGVVHDVSLAVPSPENTALPAVQVIPAATPATFPLTVTPHDASGAVILASTFASPVAISVSPPTTGVTLHVASLCPGESGPLSGTSVKLACASDISRVTVAYDGTITRSGGAVVDTSTISASPHPIDVTPEESVKVALRSALREVTYFNTHSAVAALALAPAPNGLMYFMADGLESVMGSFDPAHPSTTLKQVGAGTTIYSILVDSHNDVWLGRSGLLECYTSVTYPPKATATIGFNAPAALTQSGSNLWYEIQDQSFLTASVGFLTPGAGCSGVPASSSAIAQIGSGKFNPISAASDGSGIWATANIGGDPFDGEVFTPGVHSTGTLSSAVDFGSNYGTEGAASDGAGNLYVGLSPNAGGINPEVDKIPAGSTTPQTVATLPPNAVPYGVAVFPSTGTASQIAVVDGGYGPHRGVWLIDPTGAKPKLYVPFHASFNCFYAAYDNGGGIWAPCEDPDGNFVVFNPIITSRWAAIPSSFGIPAAAVPDSTAIAILEASGNDSSPFTVVSNSNPSVVATATPWPGVTHDIPITIQDYGTSTLTIADKYDRKQILNVNVVPTTYAKRRQRHP